MQYKESGQSLIEVVIATMVAVVVLGALIITILTSLKNAQFAQNQSKATKYAQDALDKIKTIRDRNGSVTFIYASGSPAQSTTKFSDLWNISGGLSSVGVCNTKCYLSLVSPLGLTGNYTTATAKEDLGDGLTRQIIFEDTSTTYQSEKMITVKVSWQDSAGAHESNLQTILTPK